MKVLDLFSGLGGWSQAFKDRGHEVVTVDLLEKFKPSIVADVMDLTVETLEKYGPFDVILASPPCNCFSRISISHYWKKVGKFSYPRNEKAFKAVALVKKALSLIKQLKPKFWILENPKGRLGKLAFMRNYEKRSLTFCQYGTPYQKLTDLWGRFPQELYLKKCSPGAKCHVNVPHTNAKAGNQRLGVWSSKHSQEARAKIPYELSKAVCLACEKEF